LSAVQAPKPEISSCSAPNVQRMRPSDPTSRIDAAALGDEGEAFRGEINVRDEA